MGRLDRYFKRGVAAGTAILGLWASLAGADGAERDVETLLERLRDADRAEAARIEQEIDLLWSRSGSAAIDLLLRRGRSALEVNELGIAIEHLTAVVDHAPDFAEGRHWRAIAYYRAGMPGPAMVDLETTLALEPNHYGALLAVAAVLESVGDAQRAYDAFQRVLVIHPHDDDARAGVDRLRARALGSAL